MRPRMLLIGAILTCTLWGAEAQSSTEVALHTSRTIVSAGAYSIGGYIRFTPAYSGLEGCTVADHVWIDWTAQPDAKSMYATVLAAVAAGQRLVVAVNGCSSTGIPIVYRVDVLP